MGDEPDGPDGSGPADATGAAGPSGPSGPSDPAEAAEAAGPSDPAEAAGPSDPAGVAGPEPSRGDKRLYFVLMAICIGLFVVAWLVLDRYSTIAAAIVSAVALAIPPFAAIIANAASATDRRR
jgi:hypothetical protein